MNHREIIEKIVKIIETPETEKSSGELIDEISALLYREGFAYKNLRSMANSGMNLTQAMRAMMEGKKVRSDLWEMNEYIYFDSERREIRSDDGSEVQAYTLLINESEVWFLC